MKKIIVVMAMLLCSFSAKANDWYTYPFYFPEAGNCLPIKVLFYGSMSDEAYREIPADIGPGMFGGVLMMLYRDHSSGFEIARTEDGVPRLVYLKSKEDGEEMAELSFAVARGYEQCEELRAKGIRIKQLIIDSRKQNGAK